MSGIVKLTAENVKRLKAVEITPEGSLVVISGVNGAGKSSILDTIWMALAGKKSFPPRPVREGEAAASIRLELDDLIITRTIHPDGETRLTVTAKDGARYTRPQEMLDALVTGLSFDPLAFTRMKPAQQRVQLAELVGLDFASVDGRRLTAFEQRTIENREVKRLDGELSGVPHHPDAPADEVSVSALAEELRAADAHQRMVEAAERDADRAQDAVEKAEGLAVTLRQKIEAARTELAKMEERLRDGETRALPELRERVIRQRETARQLREAGTDHVGIRAKLAGAESVNQKVRANRRRADLEAKRAAVVARSEALTATINQLDQEKLDAVAKAKYPLKGLSVNDQGVLLNGVPFEQASQAEQIRASVSIGLDLNPKLRVLLVRDGSLLNTASKKLLADLAEAAGAQVWLEVATDGEALGIVIEDGMVRSDAAVTARSGAAAAAVPA